MSSVINAVRNLLQMSKVSSMSIGDIYKKLQKMPDTMKMKKEDLTDVLEYYKKLQVVYVDQDENVVFL